MHAHARGCALTHALDARTYDEHTLHTGSSEAELEGGHFEASISRRNSRPQHIEWDEDVCDAEYDGDFGPASRYSGSAPTSAEVRESFREFVCEKCFVCAHVWVIVMVRIRLCAWHAL